MNMNTIPGGQGAQGLVSRCLLLGFGFVCAGIAGRPGAREAQTACYTWQARFSSSRNFGKQNHKTTNTTHTNTTNTALTNTQIPAGG